MPQIPETPIDWAGLLPEFLQTPARYAGRTLGELTRPVAYAQGYGPDMVTLSDLADIPQSKVGVGLTLAGMVPGSKLIKAAPKGAAAYSKYVEEIFDALRNKTRDVPIEEVLGVKPEEFRPMKGQWARTTGQEIDQ